MQQLEVGLYKGVLEMGGQELEIAGKIGREAKVLTLGLGFLGEHKPWGRRGARIEFIINEIRL